MIQKMKVEEREDVNRGRRRNVKSVRSIILARIGSKRNERNMRGGILVIQMAGRDTRKIRRGEDMILIEYTLWGIFLSIVK